VASLASTAYLGSYALILKDGWWDQPDAKFHFFYDGEYAHNVDKLGHGFAGIVFAELFYDGFRWSGVGETKSLVLAGTMSGLTHLGIEIKDGYGPTWGFSVWDVIGGTLGGFYPLAKARVPAFQYIDLKYSYWRNTDVYWKSGVDHGGVWVDDYGNETFWLSLKVKRVLPEPVAQYWPRWLALAAGVSVRGTMEGGMWGPREYFAALDWDLQAAINPRTYAGSRWVRYLNYVKLPAPAVRVYPDPAVFWLYPVKF
jgi:hypothetical protein